MFNGETFVPTLFQQAGRESPISNQNFGIYCKAFFFTLCKGDLRCFLYVSFCSAVHRIHWYFKYMLCSNVLNMIFTLLFKFYGQSETHTCDNLLPVN